MDGESRWRESRSDREGAHVKESTRDTVRRRCAREGVTILLAQTDKWEHIVTSITYTSAPAISREGAVDEVM